VASPTRASGAIVPVVSFRRPRVRCRQIVWRDENSADMHGCRKGMAVASVEGHGISQAERCRRGSYLGVGRATDQRT
jgi:hypothetical protein